tara:strand:+ start:10489 stop:11433 length:945 start_codon:yes stop_codon:yes gene_type:complete
MSKQKNLEQTRIEVSIIIISYNVKKILIQCIESILFHTNKTFKYEIIVVDNNSRDNTEKEVKENYPSINYIKNLKNSGFSKALNQAINESSGKYIFQLNPDTEFVEDSISKIHNYISNNNKLVILGPKIINDAGKVQQSHWKTPTLFYTILNLSNLQFIINLFKKIQNPIKPIKVDTISGAAMFYEASIIKKVGPFNENLFWDEDIDFCLRAEKKGYNIIFFPHTQLIHKGGKSAATNQRVAISNQVLSKIKFFQIHHSPFNQTLIKIFCMLIIPIKTFFFLLLSIFKPAFFKKASAYFFTWKLLIKRDYKIQL